MRMSSSDRGSRDRDITIALTIREHVSDQLVCKGWHRIGEESRDNPNSQTLAASISPQFVATLGIFPHFAKSANVTAKAAVAARLGLDYAPARDLTEALGQPARTVPA